MKKSVKVLIVILCLIILVLVGFIVWDKIIKKESNVSNNLESNTANRNNEQSEITREEALELGEKMYKEVEGHYEKMSKIHPNNFVQTTETVETMAKIEDNKFMENVKELLIKDAFNNFMEYYHIEDRNGEYYASTGGMGSNPTYIRTKDLTIKNMDNYTITYIATSVYDNLDQTGTETKDYEFVLTKIDGEWKVENFTIPY